MPIAGGGCTTNEVIYLNLLEAIGPDAGARKIKTAGIAVTSVPLPAAAWLFGSGLLGLIAMARRRGHRNHRLKGFNVSVNSPRLGHMTGGIFSVKGCLQVSRIFQRLRKFPPVRTTEPGDFFVPNSASLPLQSTLLITLQLRLNLMMKVIGTHVS